jgi:glyceraldehyde 3-phosphate dehydrogenase
MKVAINGFGRIGRTVARMILEDPRFELVAINDLHPADTMAHLFKYDSVHGKFSDPVSAGVDSLSLGNNELRYSQHKDPAQALWGDLGVDVVLECTGFFKTHELASKHLEAGAAKVVLSAPPADDSVKTVVLGVNDDIMSTDDVILSNASCTTNSAAPMVKILDEACGIESCYITTVHSYTGDQKLQDAPHKDWRRGRAAAVSIVPTTTGAAKALTKIFPHLSTHMGGCGIRVPVPDGSLTDITCVVRNPVSVELLNARFEAEAAGNMKGILEYTEDPIVSADIIGNTHSCIFDAQLTSVIGKMIKLVGWYDNEVGYSKRLVDLMTRIH